MFKPILEQSACDSKLTQTLGRRLPQKVQLESAMVILMFPLAQLLGELRRASEDHSAVELVCVRWLRAAFSGLFGRPRWICRCATSRSRECHGKSEPNSEQ